VIYQRALEIELRKAGLVYVKEMEMTIYYDGEDIVTRRVDFFVDDNNGGTKNYYCTGRSPFSPGYELNRSLQNGNRTIS
jgi:hypothetical protein